MGRRLNVMAGDKFNRLTIIREVNPDGYKRTFFCQCDCGNTVTVHLTSLRSSNTKSCGCLRAEVNVIKNKERTGVKNNKYVKKDMKYWDSFKNSLIGH